MKEARFAEDRGFDSRNTGSIQNNEEYKKIIELLLILECLRYYERNESKSTESDKGQGDLKGIMIKLSLIQILIISLIFLIFLIFLTNRDLIFSLLSNSIIDSIIGISSIMLSIIFYIAKY